MPTYVPVPDTTQDYALLTWLRAIPPRYVVTYTPLPVGPNPQRFVFAEYSSQRKALKATEKLSVLLLPKTIIIGEGFREWYYVIP